MAASNTGTRPAGRVLFIVPEAGRFIGDQEGGGREDKFVEVAAAWKTEKGGYRFTLDSVPALLLAGKSVTFIVSPIDPDPQSMNQQKSGPAPAPNTKPRGR